MRTPQFVLAGIAVALIATACGAAVDAPTAGDATTSTVSGDDSSSVPQTTTGAAATTVTTVPEETTTMPDRSDRLDTDTTLPNAEPVDPPPASKPVVGEVPAAILDPILADAATRVGSDLVVVRAESVIWSDGSLGCPEPGMAYTQALVEGYWVVVEGGGSSVDYRVTQQGGFIVCTQPGATGGTVPTAPTS